MNFSPNLVFLNRSFDKKRLKALLLWFRLNLSEGAALEAVEILQGLGFRSATQGAISLGLDDLKTPTSKNGRVFQAQLEVALAHHEHHRGNRTPVELFQHLVDTWHRTSQDLTTEVVQLFHSTERVNPVYMMAFSGARGNLSQVRQLVGMRGLMADPRGQIVGFPILSNFREGLTITEYFVSCYGARKGVVDTAIRTADAGYLTRRLADVSHHFVVRTTNCGTHRTICLRDIKEGQKTILPLASRLVGRVLGEHIPKIAFRNQEITPDLASKLASQCTSLQVRSPLSCALRWGVCQLCYGWGLSEGRRVTLGEAVGIIAAQSIGEPGTQLTLRTFHTGGVFSGDLLNEIRAPYNGTVSFPNPLQGLLVRTPHGQIAFLTKVSGKMILSFSLPKEDEEKAADTCNIGDVTHASKADDGVQYTSGIAVPASCEAQGKKMNQTSEASKKKKENSTFSSEASDVSLKPSASHEVRLSCEVSSHRKGGLQKGGDDAIPLQPEAMLASCEAQTFSTASHENASAKLLDSRKNQVQKENKEFSLQPSTVIFVRQKEQVTANQLLAEFSSSTLQPISDQIEVTQQVLSESAGQVWFQKVEYGNRKGPGSGSLGTHFSSQKLGGVWVLAGKPRSEILLNDRRHFLDFPCRAKQEGAQVLRRKKSCFMDAACQAMRSKKMQHELRKLSSIVKKGQLILPVSQGKAMPASCEAQGFSAAIVKYQPLHNVYYDDHFFKYHYSLGYSKLLRFTTFLFAEKRVHFPWTTLPLLRRGAQCIEDAHLFRRKKEAASCASHEAQDTFTYNIGDVTRVRARKTASRKAQDTPAQIKIKNIFLNEWQKKGVDNFSLLMDSRRSFLPVTQRSNSTPTVSGFSATSVFSARPFQPNVIKKRDLLQIKESTVIGPGHAKQEEVPKKMNGETGKRSLGWWLQKKWKAAPGILLAEPFFSSKEHSEGQIFWLSSSFIQHKRLTGSTSYPTSHLPNTFSPIHNAQCTFGAKVFRRKMGAKVQNFCTEVDYLATQDKEAAMLLKEPDFYKASVLNTSLTDLYKKGPIIIEKVCTESRFNKTMQSKGLVCKTPKYSLLQSYRYAKAFAPKMHGKCKEQQMFSEGKYVVHQRCNPVIKKLIQTLNLTCRQYSSISRGILSPVKQNSTFGSFTALLNCASSATNSSTKLQFQGRSTEAMPASCEAQGFPLHRKCIENDRRLWFAKGDVSHFIKSETPFHFEMEGFALKCSLLALRNRQECKKDGKFFQFFVIPLYLLRMACASHEAGSASLPSNFDKPLEGEKDKADNKPNFALPRFCTNNAELTKINHIRFTNFLDSLDLYKALTLNLFWQPLSLASYPNKMVTIATRKPNSIAPPPLRTLRFTDHNLDAACQGYNNAFGNEPKNVPVDNQKLRFSCAPSCFARHGKQDKRKGKKKKEWSNVWLSIHIPNNNLSRSALHSQSEFEEANFLKSNSKLALPHFPSENLAEQKAASCEAQDTCYIKDVTSAEQSEWIKDAQKGLIKLSVALAKRIFWRSTIATCLAEQARKPVPALQGSTSPLLASHGKVHVHGAARLIEIKNKPGITSGEAEGYTEGFAVEWTRVTKQQIAGKRKRVEKNDSSLDQHIVHTVNLPIVDFPYLIPSADQKFISTGLSNGDVHSGRARNPLRGLLRKATLIASKMNQTSEQGFPKENEARRIFHARSLPGVQNKTIAIGCIETTFIGKSSALLVKLGSTGAIPLPFHSKRGRLHVRSMMQRLRVRRFTKKMGGKKQFKLGEKTYYHSKCGTPVQGELLPLIRQSFWQERFFEVKRRSKIDSPPSLRCACNVSPKDTGADLCIDDAKKWLSNAFLQNGIFHAVPASQSKKVHRKTCEAQSKEEADSTGNIFKALRSKHEKHLRILDIQFKVELPIKIISNLQGRYTSAHVTLPPKNLVSFAPLTNKPHTTDALTSNTKKMPRYKAKFMFSCAPSPSTMPLPPLFSFSLAERPLWQSKTMPASKASQKAYSARPSFARVHVSPIFSACEAASQQVSCASHKAAFAHALLLRRFTKKTSACSARPSKARFSEGFPKENSSSHPSYRLMQQIVEYPMERSIFNRWVTTRRRKLQYSLLQPHSMQLGTEAVFHGSGSTLTPLHALTDFSNRQLKGEGFHFPSENLCTFAPLHLCTEGASCIVHRASCIENVSNSSACFMGSARSCSDVSLSQPYGREASLQPFGVERDDTNDLPIRNKVWIADKKFTSFDDAIFLDWYAFPLHSCQSPLLLKDTSDMVNVAPTVSLSDSYKPSAIRVDSMQSVAGYISSVPNQLSATLLQSSKITTLRTQLLCLAQLSSPLQCKPEGVLHSSLDQIPLKEIKVPFLSESDQITFITNDDILLSNYQKHITLADQEAGVTVWQSKSAIFDRLPLTLHFSTKNLHLHAKNSMAFSMHDARFGAKVQRCKKKPWSCKALHPLKMNRRVAEPTYTYLYPGQLVTYGEKMDQKIATTESGQVLYLDSQRATLRKAQTVLIYSQAILSVLSGEWIKKSAPLMALSYQKLVTGDIVQGLPKIEQFFEAPLLKDGTFWSDSLQAKLNLFFQEHRGKFPLAEAVRKGFSDIQRVLVEGVQRVYISQGVLIADKHLEVIVRQMTCKGRILYSGDTGFLRNELVALDKIESVNQVTYGQKALYHPQVRGITDASLESESFLSAASFQETTRVLSRDAVIGKTDLMRGLKERVIVGELIQAGTGLTNNSVYSFLLD